MIQTIMRLAVLVGLPLLVLGACARTEPARFYLLHSLSGSELDKPGERVETNTTRVGIGIETVKIAPYLDRPEIATRPAPYRVQFAEFDRWAEPLQDNIAEVLAENLSVLLRSDRIALFPWSAGTVIDYRVVVEVMRFDNELGKEALLRSRWTILGPGERKPLVSRKADYRQPIAAGDYESLAAANSRLLADLSRDIAVALGDLH